MEAEFTPKRWYVSAKLNGVRSQNIMGSALTIDHDSQIFPASLVTDLLIYYPANFSREVTLHNPVG
jgi:hypothetical protein